MFKVQDEITAAVIEALKVQLLLATNVRTKYRPANDEAYDHYLLRSSPWRLTIPHPRRGGGQLANSSRFRSALDPAFGPNVSTLARVR